MVAVALAGDREDVAVGRLVEPRVLPDDHGVVAVEVAEGAPAGLARSVQPLQLAAPRERVALAGVALDRVVAPQLCRVRALEVGAAPVLGDLPAIGHPAGR